MPAPSELPAPLASLGRYQGIELSEDRWDYDVGRLATRLAEVVGPPASDVATQAAGSFPPRRGMGRNLAVGAGLVAVLLVVAAVVLVRGGSEPPPQQVSPREVQLHVPARGPQNASGWGMRWTDTGIDVDEQMIRIEATGQVNAGDGNFVSPDGTPDRPDFDIANVLRGAQHAGLIGRFGKSGQPFVVGSHYRSYGTASGRLYLGVNDIDAQTTRGSSSPPSL